MEMSDVKKFMKWMKGRDTGLSSEALGFHMIMGESTGNYPYDPADLGRCLRLIELFPEWESRIGEMEKYGKEWASYAKEWGMLRDTMKDEVGINWEKGGSAGKTYALMKKLADR